MAKPIRATPKLTPEETNHFLSEMVTIEKAPVSSSEKKLAKEISKFTF